MKKFVSLLLSSVFFISLVACGGDAVSSVVPGPSSISVPEPVPLEQAYLTGLEKTADYPEGQRIMGVMVNNIEYVWSGGQAGLSDAKILFEVKAEGGITRFLALFEDYKALSTVGPVRSARDQHYQLLLPSWGFYVHDGPNQNQPVLTMMDTYDYDEFDITPDYEGGVVFRDYNRPAYLNGNGIEHTEFTSGERLTKYIKENELDDHRSYGSPIFNFTPYNEEPRVLSEGTANEVWVSHSSSYRSVFDYDATTNKYDMSHGTNSGKTPYIDTNNDEQLAFDNVIVLFAPMSIYPASYLVKVDYSQGIGFYFNGGNFETIRWMKGGPDTPLRLYVNDTTETALQVNPGTSYVGIVDTEMLEAFDDSVRTGQGGANVEGESTVTGVEAD